MYAAEYRVCLIGDRSAPQAQTQSCQLRLNDNVESGTEAKDDEHPNHIPYMIEWRVTLNNGTLIKDTEQDLKFTPCSY